MYKFVLQLNTVYFTSSYFACVLMSSGVYLVLSAVQPTCRGTVIESLSSLNFSVDRLTIVQQVIF